MRVLVVGGAGYIGAHMCRMLNERGHEITVLDDLSTGYRAAVKWGSLVECSLRDKPRLLSVFTNGRFDAVFHFAGAIVVTESVIEPLKYYSGNVAGTLNLLEAMHATGVNKLVFSSTAAIFGQPVQRLVGEDHPIAPINPYGHSKAMSEQMLRDCAAAYGLRAVALRYFNAAGADSGGMIGEAHLPETHLIPRLLQAAKEGTQMTIYGADHPTPDGTCVRDYVHVNDLCTAHLQALEFMSEHEGFHGFNLGNGSGFSVLEVLRAVEQISGVKVAASYGPSRAWEPAQLVACSGKARALLQWEPRTPGILEIVESAWRWHLAPKY